MFHRVGFGQARRGARALSVVAAVGIAVAASAASAWSHDVPGRIVRSSVGRDDPRWDAWLGCWQPDTTGPRAPADRRVTCVVPSASGSSAVELLSISGGRVAATERLDVNGRPQPMHESGCSGVETAQWSSTQTRIYVRGEYTCGSVRGTSTRLLAISPTGEWLDFESVRSGGGSLEHLIRRRDVGVVAGVPADIAAVLRNRRLAISAARASAAAPLSTNDVIDALRVVDASIVRAWIIQTGTRFALTGLQATALVQANVPMSVIQAMMGDTRTEEEIAAETAAGAAAAYLASPSAPVVVSSVPGYGPDGMYPPPCPPPGCYGPNPYSMYNGYGYSPYPGYPYSPFGFGATPFFGAPIIIVTNGNGFNGFNRGTKFGGVPVRGHGPVVNPFGVHAPFLGHTVTTGGRR